MLLVFAILVGFVICIILIPAIEAKVKEDKFRKLVEEVKEALIWQGYASEADEDDYVRRIVRSGRSQDVISGRVYYGIDATEAEMRAPIYEETMTPEEKEADIRYHAVPYGQPFSQYEVDRREAEEAMRKLCRQIPPAEFLKQLQTSAEESYQYWRTRNPGFAERIKIQDAQRIREYAEQHAAALNSNEKTDTNIEGTSSLTMPTR
jgi:hypothetical protein